MSGGLDVLALKEDDVTKLLVASAHLGAENVNFQMERYVYKKRVDGKYSIWIYYYLYFLFSNFSNAHNILHTGAGINIIDIRHTWEKLLLAARAIVAIEHPSEVFAVSCRHVGQRAVLKFAAHTGATPIAGRFTPGAFTNQIQV